MSAASLPLGYVTLVTQGTSKGQGPTADSEDWGTDWFLDSALY